MSLAFGEPPCSGVTALPSAAGASASRATRAAARAAASTRRLSCRGKAAGSYPRLRGHLHFVTDGASGALLRRAQLHLASLEGRLPLLHEGRDSLPEVVAAGQLVLELGLEVELAPHVAEQHPVERLLGGRVGAGRTARQLRH